MEILYAIGAIASALAAVLAWLAKIRWSNEFAKAKDATIAAKQSEVAAKEAQITSLRSEIESLRNLTPMKIREYFTSVKAQLEEYNEELQRQLDDARTELDAKDAQIADLSKQGEVRTDAIRELNEEREALLRDAEELKAQIRGISQRAVLHGVLAPLQRMELAIHLADQAVQAGKREDAVRGLRRVRSSIPEISLCVRTFLDAAGDNQEHISGSQAVKVEDIVNRVVRELGPLAEKAGQRLLAHFHAAPVLPMKDADLELILANLIHNAVKYSFRNTEIDIRCTQEKDEFVLDVISHGVAIPEAERDRIFDPGYRTAKAASVEYAAAGLGLFAARQAAERWGGKLLLKSSEPEPNGTDPAAHRNTFRLIVGALSEDS